MKNRLQRAAPGTTPEAARIILRQGRGYFYASALLGFALAMAPWLLLPGFRAALTVLPTWQLGIAALLLVPAHELAHALAYRLCGGRRVRSGVSFAARMVPIAAWCLLAERLPRGLFVAVLLAPQVLVPAAAALLAIPAVLAGLLVTLNLADGGGDLLLATAVLRSGARVVQDGSECVVAVR